MKIYGVDLAEGSQITNTTVASGTSYPSNPNVGELFYLTSGTVGLYIHNGSTWLSLASASMVGYTHVQSSGATTWTITHNMGTTNVQISTYIDDTGGTFAKIIPQSERIIDTNTVEVVFSTNRTGKVILVGLV